MAVLMNEIKPGSRGEDVLFARRLLTAYGAGGLEANDLFDQEMEQAVLRFKAQCGLDAGAAIDAKAWNCLAPVLNRDTISCNRERALKLAQAFLHGKGFFRFKPDGLYGVDMQITVEIFQRARGLRADGIWGRECWNAWFEDPQFQSNTVAAMAY